MPARENELLRSFSLDAGQYWVFFKKIAKINSQQENQSVLIAKISSPKTQKIANPQE